MSEPLLRPPTALLCKLASIAVHVDEMLSPDGHQFDRIALETLINDQEVKSWLRDMGRSGFVPVKRKEGK